MYIRANSGSGGGGGGAKTGHIENVVKSQSLQVDTGLLSISLFIIYGGYLNQNYDKAMLGVYDNRTPSKSYFMNGGVYGGTGGQQTLPNSATDTRGFVINSISGGTVSVTAPTEFDSGDVYWFAI